MTIYSPTIGTSHIKFDRMNNHSFNNNNTTNNDNTAATANGSNVFNTYVNQDPTDDASHPHNHSHLDTHNLHHLHQQRPELDNINDQTNDFPYPNNEHNSRSLTSHNNEGAEHVYSYYNDNYEYKDYDNYNDYEEDGNTNNYSTSVAPSSITPQQIIYASELNSNENQSLLCSKRLGRRKKSSVDCFDSIDFSNNNQDLIMTREEAELLTRLNAKERRQLRNKISARNFRIRRKEYISSLENKVEQQECETKRLKEELKDKGLEVLRLKNEVLRLSKAINKNGLNNTNTLHSISDNSNILKYEDEIDQQPHHSIFVNNNNNTSSISHHYNNNNMSINLQSLSENSIINSVQKKEYDYNSQDE